MDLSQVEDGQRVLVVAVRASARENRRLTELGVRAGAEIEVVRRAPLGGPLALRVGGGLLALRPENARRIEVEPPPPTEEGGGRGPR